MEKTVYMLASVLDTNVHIQVKNENGKVILGGMVGAILYQDKLPTTWELVDFEIPCGGMFGTVKIIARIPKEEK